MMFTKGAWIKLSKNLVLVLLLFLIALVCSSFNGSRTISANTDDLTHSTKGNGCNYSLKDFNMILSSIEQAVAFFESNVDSIVLDASMGTRVLEAQINLVLNSSTKVLSQNIIDKLTNLLTRSESLSNTIFTSYRANRNIPIFEKLQAAGWVQSAKLWEMPKIQAWKPKSDMEEYFTDNKTIIKPNNYFSDKFDGDLSDRCIHQLFLCEYIPIDNNCKEYFFTKPTSSYTLNHQILYVIMAEQRKCHKTAKYSQTFEAVGGWDKFRKDLCGKAWFLSNVVAKKGFTPRYRDLFMEQIAVCSLAGYSNFLRKEWMYEILSWQEESGLGCFPQTDLENRLIITVLSDYDYIDVEPPLNISKAHLLVPENLVMVVKPHQVIRKDKRKAKRNAVRKHRRTKRHEQVFVTKKGEKCLTHLTAMGIMALSIHLRYLVETCHNSILTEKPINKA